MNELPGLIYRVTYESNHYFVIASGTTDAEKKWHEYAKAKFGDLSQRSRPEFDLLTPKGEPIIT